MPNGFACDWSFEGRGERTQNKRLADIALQLRRADMLAAEPMRCWKLPLALLPAAALRPEPTKNPQLFADD